jgi:pimeloyl-ACP methyl ester carboxylesterase
MDQDEVEGEANTTLAPSSSTLLPTPIANVVSLVARSSSLYLRLGTFIGGLALDGARITTLTGLELSRAVIEGILHRAGRDVATRSTGELGQAEAEGLLERSIGTLHSTITSISFAASTGFHFSSTILSSTSDLSQQLLVTLDSILGSTDSSRAIASIVTLIRREFQNPATGEVGEKVSVADLLVGICGLALLQRWCKTITDEECREKKCEEVVWDVVILDDGRRADVVGNEADRKALTRADSMSFVSTNGDELVQTIQREGRVHDDSDDDLPEINLKQKIMRTLPPDTSVSITTETTTTKTITVEIIGTQPPDLSPPLGVEIVEETTPDVGSIDGGAVLSNEQKIALLIPRYRVVYRIIRERMRSTDVESKALELPEDAIVSDEEVELVPKENATALGPIVPSSPVSEKAPLLPEKDSPTTSNTNMTSVTSDIGDEKTSAIPRPKSTEVIANQKRSRKPMSTSSSISGEIPPPKEARKSPPTKKVKPERPSTKPSEKKGSFRNALRKGSEKTLSNLWNKDHAESKPAPSKPQWNVGNSSMTAPKSNIPVPQRNSSIVPQRDAPRPPQRGNPNFFSSRDLGLPDVPRSPSRASYYSVHERRRDSLVSQTDTYSIHSAETRPGSPNAFRSHLRTQSNMLRARSEKNIVKRSSSPAKNHQRSRSCVPSIYTLKTNMSNTSLVLADQPRKSAFQDSQTLEYLMRTGFVPGLFPHNHIVRNICRFVRFASASYGASFLRIMGITSSQTATSREIDTLHHHEHHSFSTHTQLPADTILLSSFVDPQGGTDSTGKTNTGVPMVHFVSLDHDSKAVVLTCRGTLGFEDILTDLTCDYDELLYRGKAYKVHKGFHASARRLLDGGGGRVMATIAAALEEFPDYGLVLCGHSLGGAVTALLATLISEPSSDSSSSAFFTSSEETPQLLLTSSEKEKGTAPWRIQLPAGRPIHVYAYGPPSTMSPSLRLATRGLITTIVNGQDLVPYLSLGVLHDLQAVALAFKTDDSGAKGEVRRRVWAGITGTFADKWYSNRPPTMHDDEDDQWAYSALKTLRASMLSAKLFPPGEVFVVDAMPVLQRDAFLRSDEARGLGRPATRSILKYVRDVEGRFSEVTFGGSMLLDHSPGRYEASLGALRKGVLGQRA